MDVPLKFRSYVTNKKIIRYGVVFLSLVQCVGFSSVTFSDDVTLKERQHYQAQQLREASEARAQSHVGYENIYRDPRNRQIDYYALTQQINNLSNIVRSLSETQQVNSSLNLPPSTLPRALSPVSGPSRSSNNIPGNNIYGPAGPSEKAVRLLLEYQLMINGNERLKIGEIQEEEKFIIAEVVTVEGSLVERYKIDKTNGSWIAD
ncbi:hypothetical protein WH95_11130 [Kiloniella litopenaei]|uniref:Uncharacterized protein n=1 Tax=Kiloniella litopenaei TaxID=1549748 RepID=A0A0M2R9P0_9PROT|nr:hypothetical protein [Kiloniella litopenaei]KKJ76690.1 hypothetical protein WH95_11130 [Kiloniella litopenaei]